MSVSKRRRFPPEIILLCVRWYCRYGISYRDLEEMMTERGVGVDYSTLYRWVQCYAPELEVRWYQGYRLARDIRGIGFKSADQIAGKLGIEKTAMIRARAGIGYALTEAMDEGHCGLPHEQLLTMAAKLLEVPAAIIEGALEMELNAGEVVADTADEKPCIFLAG